MQKAKGIRHKRVRLCRPASEPLFEKGARSRVAKRCHLFLWPFAFCLSAAAATPAPAAGPQSPAPALTPAELARANELRDLVTDGKALLDMFAKTDGARETALPQADKERRVREILARYERLLRDNPDDPEALILYGKFLRAVGERELAFKAFLRADRNAPDLAVVKHQLGAHLAEDGEYSEALPLLRRAVELAPAEPRYRYDFAEFLAAAGDPLADSRVLARDERDRLMLENFAEAARLKPAEAGYRWRAAEAFHDVAKPDARAALAAWDALAREARTDLEREAVSLHRAKWLILLGRSDEARKLIAASSTPSLDATRRKLLDLLQTHTKALRPGPPAPKR